MMVPPMVKTFKDNVDVLAYEGCDFVGGSDLTPQNHCRPSLMTSSVQSFKAGASFTSTGTCFYTDFIPGETSVTPLVSGGVISQDVNPWILTKNEKYMIRLVNNSNDDNKCNVFLEWMEIETV